MRSRSQATGLRDGSDFSIGQRAATNEAALTIVPREALEECAVDVPDDVSALEFPSGSAAQIRAGAFRFSAGGNGSAGNFTLTARGAATADRITTTPITNATYQLNADGTGTFTLPGSALLTGIRTLWLSADASLANIGRAHV